MSRHVETKTIRNAMSVHATAGYWLDEYETAADMWELSQETGLNEKEVGAAMTYLKNEKLGTVEGSGADRKITTVNPVPRV